MTKKVVGRGRSMNAKTCRAVVEYLLEAADYHYRHGRDGMAHGFRESARYVACCAGLTITNIGGATVRWAVRE